MSAEGRQAVEAVQSQLEEQRERGRREQQEHQRLSRDRIAELEKAQNALHSMQEEVREAAGWGEAGRGREKMRWRETGEGNCRKHGEGGVAEW